MYEFSTIEKLVNLPTDEIDILANVLLYLDRIAENDPSWNDSFESH